MRYLDRNVQVFYFLLDSSTNHRGFSSWIPLCSHSWKLHVAEGVFQTDKGFWRKRGFRGRIWKNRKCIDLAGRKKALCRRQGSVLCEYLELHQRWKEKVVGYIHEHEQHYPACLSELINTTRHMLLFTCKGIFVRIYTICKCSWKNYEEIIKHDLINWCRIGMDFYSVKKKKKVWSNSVINILTAYHWLTFPLPASHPIRNNGIRWLASDAGWEDTLGKRTSPHFNHSYRRQREKVCVVHHCDWF